MCFLGSRGPTRAAIAQNGAWSFVTSILLPLSDQQPVGHHFRSFKDCGSGVNGHAVLVRCSLFGVELTTCKFRVPVH